MRRSLPLRRYLRAIAFDLAPLLSRDFSLECMLVLPAGLSSNGFFASIQISNTQWA